MERYILYFRDVFKLKLCECIRFFFFFIAEIQCPYSPIILNSLPNDNILGWTKLEVFADDMVNVAQMMIFLCNRVEKHWKKEKMLGTGIFSFSQVSKASFYRSGLFGSVKSPLSLVLQMSLYLEAFESNTTSDWLN